MNSTTEQTRWIPKNNGNRYGSKPYNSRYNNKTDNSWCSKETTQGTINSNDESKPYNSRYNGNKTGGHWRSKETPRESFSSNEQSKPWNRKPANENKPVKKSIALPNIYDTHIPAEFEKCMLEANELTIVKAYTGCGKTVSILHKMAHINSLFYKERRGRITCVGLMPFRASIRNMHSFLSELFPELRFGYAMKGESKTSPQDNCRLNTVGYWLETFLTSYKKYGLPKDRMIVFVDEAHDASWQTDLALQVILWAQSKGSPIQVVVSSATLDVNETMAKFPKAKLLSLEEREANVDKIFTHNYISPMHQGKLSQDFTKWVKSIIFDITEKSDGGDIIILLPGQDEIETMIKTFNKDKSFETFALRPLYSSLSKEEQLLAINLDNEGKRKIIFATNMIENAITIPNLMFTIDCGLRKVNTIDSNGISSLILVLASQSNMIQFAGRSGRLGVRGTAFLWMTNDQFQTRQAYSENEVHVNPLYLQIIKLASNNLPIKEVLAHVAPEKVDNDTEFLIRHGVLEKHEDGTIEVTPTGRLMSNLPLSIRSGHFLAHALQNMHEDDLNSTTLYILCVVAIWIDTSNSIFYRQANRNDDEELARIIEDRLERQSDLYRKDCLTTMLNIWFSSWTETVNYSGGFKAWCLDNGLFEKALREMQIEINHLVSSLSNIGYTVTVPDVKTCEQILGYYDIFAKELIPSLKVAFFDWTFKVGNFNSLYYNDVLNCSSRIDKSVANLSTMCNRFPDQVIPMSIKKIANGSFFISKIVDISM